MGNEVGTVYAIAIVFSLLALVATALRFYARNIKKVGFSWDDYVIIPALVRQNIPPPLSSVLRYPPWYLANCKKVLTFATAIAMMVGTANGDLGRHTEIGEQDGWPIPIITPRTKVFQKVG
ncbi:MAG: hypothetical protein Q9216_006187 [Gyalolechia sp. 2 TL-2023]